MTHSGVLYIFWTTAKPAPSPKRLGARGNLLPTLPALSTSLATQTPYSRVARLRQNDGQTDTDGP